MSTALDKGADLAGNAKTEPRLLLRSLPLVVATVLFVLPAPTLMIQVSKLAAVLALLAWNTRWGESRVWYAFVLYLVVLISSFVPALRTWNPLVVPALGVALVACLRPSWLAANQWFVRGRPSGASWVLLATTIPLSAIALWTWAHITEPDLSDYAAMIPMANIGLVIAAAIVFAVFNAIAEELVFRGVLWQALCTIGFRGFLLLSVQAVAFGIFHFNGVPSGMAGMGLATLYGFALGGVRMLSKGLLMPVLLHITADLTIFLLVLRLIERW